MVISPAFIVRDGFTETFPIETRPFLQASVAIVRVLKMRVAHHPFVYRTSFSFSMTILLIVELCHGQLYACQTETFYDLSCTFETGG